MATEESIDGENQRLSACSESSQSDDQISQINRNSIPLPNKLKYLTAAAIFYGNITFGISLNTYGPAATTMQNKYETNDAKISTVFTILTACYMVGALSAGFLYRFINRQIAAVILMATMGTMMFVTPYCPTITLFFISAGIMGYCVGLYDVAQFIWIMEMMQKDCPPFVQSQHFSYAFGASLSSLIMAPFLDKKDDEPITTLSSFSIEDSTYSPHSIGNISYEVFSKKAEHGTRLYIPYTIAAVLMWITSVSQILLFVFMRYYPPPPEIMDNEQIEKERDVEESSLSGNIAVSSGGFKIGSWSLAKFRMVVLSASFYGAYQAMEMCTFQFFPKFGQNSPLALSEADSTYVLTGMQAVFAVGRAIAIIAVFKISLQLILCGNLLLVVVANVLLVGWASNSLPVLWTASILFGFGFSSMYASFSAYMERYLVFTDFIGSIMIVCGSGVSAIYPLIIGKFIDKNVIVLSYTNFFSITLICLAFGTLSFLTFRNKTRY